MIRLPHGYTNRTELVGDNLVFKRYAGKRAAQRCKVEETCLRYLKGLMPVPEVVTATSNELQMTRLCGAHGQDLIADGHAESVLHALGKVLRHLHDLPMNRPPPLQGSGPVIVHGDFGPQNILLTRSYDEVAGILDWEWAHLGDRVEDLAWAEWVVRSFHPDSTTALTALFEAYGETPSWDDRQEHIVHRCEELGALDPIQRGGESPQQLWARQAAIARSWAPLPSV